jgi:hypothetical protein
MGHDVVEPFVCEWWLARIGHVGSGREVLVQDQVKFACICARVYEASDFGLEGEMI